MKYTKNKQATNTAQRMSNDIRKIFIAKMKEKNMSQSDLARATDKSRSHITIALNNSERSLSLAMIVQLCKALDLELRVYMKDCAGDVKVDNK